MNSTGEAMKYSEEILNRTRHALRSGDKRAARVSLRSLLSTRVAAFHHARALGRLAEYAAYLYVALVIDLDDDERESIEAAELAYAGLSESIETDGLYEITRQRVLLLHKFTDYLADSWMELFAKRYRESDRIRARNLALESFEQMQLADVHDLEQRFGKQRVDADEGLNDACNTIHLPAPPTREMLEGAALMHRAFHAYLKTKYSL
jgi:hypothetical protein